MQQQSFRDQRGNRIAIPIKFDKVLKSCNERKEICQKVCCKLINSELLFFLLKLSYFFKIYFLASIINILMSYNFIEKLTIWLKMHDENDIPRYS